MWETFWVSGLGLQVSGAGYQAQVQVLVLSLYPNLKA
jgi:hypothetical protein